MIFYIFSTKPVIFQQKIVALQTTHIEANHDNLTPPRPQDLLGLQAQPIDQRRCWLEMHASA